jgi:hypothetical protein
MTKNNITSKNRKLKEIYYICPSCGELSTYSKQIEGCSAGAMPYCYCEFSGERGRIFVGYKRINKRLWAELKKLKTDKLRLKEYIKDKTNKLRKEK